MKVNGEQLNELHNKLLELLKFFKEYCAQNNLRFFLAFGSCLGAVRDKGFIPWDDDVDIVMPPEDYHRLKQLWKSGDVVKHYTLCDAAENYCDGHLELTIRDNNTTYITLGDIELDTNHGIMIEISPLSFSPNSKLEQAWQTLNAALYAIFRVQRIPNTGGKMQKKIVQLLMKVIPPKKRYRIWKFAEKQVITLNPKKCKKVRVFGQFHTLKRYYPAEYFSDVAWLPFEDTEMPVPIMYHEYLTMHYGDYMSPPPPKDRQPVHEIEFVDCHNSYLNYRGIYYLKGKVNRRLCSKVNENPELREVQKACFQILKKFCRVCEANNLQYYLAYGTLLGAIRHKGYIPWDDDIDVWMPRPDMERFLKMCCEQMKPYVVNYYPIHNNASFKYRSQPCIEDHSFRVGFDLGGKIKLGYIWIDIMPLDGMPTARWKQKVQCRRFSFMYTLIGFARSARIGAFNKNSKHGIKKFGVQLNEKLKIGKMLNVDKMLYRFDKIRKRYKFEESKYVIGTTTSYTDKAIFKKSWFKGTRYAEFEGEQFKIPKESERILVALYNDYMKLPPEGKRVRSHFAKLYKKGNECENE